MNPQVKPFLQKIAAQRRLIIMHGKQKKVVTDTQIRQVEAGADWSDPCRFLLEHYDTVALVCPPQMYDELNNLMEQIR
jgi:hypothetical protein